MMTYYFKIENDFLSPLSHFNGVSGNKNVYLCNFDITCEEENAVWFAVFKNNDGVYVAPLENGACKIPYEVLENTGLLHIGCYAECDGEKRISTNWLKIEVQEGAYSEGTAPTPPDEELWETLLRNSVPVINENGNWFTYDMIAGEYVDTGFSASGDKGDRGEQGIQGPKGDTGAQGYTPQKGIDYFTASDIAEISAPIDKAMRIAMYGKDIVPSADSNFEFTEIENGTAVSVRCADVSISGNIVIPYEHNGKPVTTLSDYAFGLCNILTSITIPKSVTNIGIYAFSECSNLTSITIPDSVTSIKQRTFYKCSSLTSITIPDGVTGIGNYAFRECSNLTSITIPKSVTSIGTNVFLDINQNAVVYCFSGSVAETYCAGNGIPYVCNEQTSVITQSAPSAITLADNTEYYLTDVTSLTFTYPNNTHWQSLIVLTTASSGTVSISFPQGTAYIGDAPTFDNGEIWEISIRDGVVITGKVVSGS